MRIRQGLLGGYVSKARAKWTLVSGAGADIILAQVRHDEGSRAAARMRKAGRTPGILFSLPGDASILVSMETKQVNTLVGTPVVPLQSLHMSDCEYTCTPRHAA